MNLRSGKSRRGWLLAGAILLLVLFVPFPYLASPRWEISVVSEDGAPGSGVTAELSYTNYSAESHVHEIRLTTDPAGRVVFEVQHGHASIAQRVFYTILNAMGGVHASFGRSAGVLVFGPGGSSGSIIQDGHVYFWRGSPTSMQSKIILPSH